MLKGKGLVSQVVWAVAIVVLTGSFAQASLIPVGIGADANAMATQQGRVEYRGFGSIVAADVEYAVYEPGQFDASFAGMDPSGGTQYVYAYQVYNDLQPHPTLYGTIGTVTLFSIGVIDGIASNIGSVAGSGDLAPNPATIIPSTARWEFTGDGQLAHPQVSDVLIFTSAYGPGEKTASVSGSAGGAGTHMLPSPVPEPAGAMLLISGLAAVMRRRNR